MKSIFAKIFSFQLSSSLTVLIVMSLVSVFALNTSVSNWNTGKKEDLEAVIVPVVSKVHRLNGGLSAANLKNAMEPYMTDSLYVYVFNERKEPILLMDRGKQITAGEFEKQLGPVQSFLAQNPPLPIRDGERIIGYIAVSNVDFFAYKANRLFVSTITKVVSAGIIITTVLALVISLIISSSFSRQAKSLVSGITALSRGKRNVSFPPPGTLELDMISRSAEILQEQLEKEERLRRQWMQDISHDLRTPVTAIKAQFEAMLDGVLDISKLRLASLLTELNRVELLVRNLQELSRYESPEMKISPARISSRVFLDDIRERFSFLCGQKGIQLVCECTDFFLSADEHLLQRCVSNIVQNALQHTEHGGTIHIGLSSSGTDAAVQIDNTGHIPEENIGRLFDRLYRGNSGRPEGGSGLGLSIVKAIMDLHGGSVSAVNTDTSARFVLFFPGRAETPLLR